MIVPVMSVRLLVKDRGAFFLFFFRLSVFFFIKVRVMKWWAESSLQNCWPGRVGGGVIGERTAEAHVVSVCRCCSFIKNHLSASVSGRGVMDTPPSD